MIATGNYQMGGTGKKHKALSTSAKEKLSQIAKNRPVHHCDICNRDIRGEMNWLKHLNSAKHEKCQSSARALK